MKKCLAMLASVCLLLMPLTTRASVGDSADECYTVFTDSGDQLFQIAGTVNADDEYISADNKLYRIKSADEGQKTAVAILSGDEEMPDVSWLDAQEAVSVYAPEQKKLIAMYVTHSDESYIPTDGTESKETRGGIYDVAEELKAALEKRGITVALDTSTHLPHDGGAYRRSRQTATRLAEKGPDALIDIHRDGIPAPEEYTHTVKGENVSKVRLLVGKANQNSDANRAFAKQIKAVADKMYPGLIKDIFIGKGNYNQEIMPHAILLEFGTHTISKERAIASADLMANVLSKTLYGEVSGSTSGSAGNTTQKSASSGGTQAGASGGSGADAAQSDAGSGSGIVWMLVIAGVAVLVFAFLATGSGKGMGEKIRRNTSEITGGLFGKRPDKDNPPK